LGLIYKYADEGLSAAQLTDKYSKSFGSVSKGLAKVNIVGGVVTTGITGAKIYNDYNDPNKEVDGWDVADFSVGAASTTISGLAMIGVVSNPVGWVVGIGAGGYFLYRVITD
jgi:TRAP-type C4-dicarboxylate transport system permease large subunit